MHGWYLQTHLCSSTSPASQPYREIDNRQTRGRLSFSYRQPPGPATHVQPCLRRASGVWRISRSHVPSQSKRKTCSRQQHVAGSVMKTVHTSNLSRNSSMPALSPVRYFGAMLDTSTQSAPRTRTVSSIQKGIEVLVMRVRQKQLVSTRRPPRKWDERRSRHRPGPLGPDSGYRPIHLSRLHDSMHARY